MDLWDFKAGMNHDGNNGCVQSSNGCDGCTCGSAPQDAEGPSGWGLVIPAITAFLLPLLTALTGAIVMRGHSDLEAVGGVSGLIVGALIASVILHTWRRRLEARA